MMRPDGILAVVDAKKGNEMAVGILLAGGVGQRMGASVPKQFLEVDGKPIICYPLSIMEKHPQIDSIEIVCVESFIDGMWDIVREYGFSKVKDHAGRRDLPGFHVERDQESQGKDCG